MAATSLGEARVPVVELGGELFLEVFAEQVEEVGGCDLVLDEAVEVGQDFVVEDRGDVARVVVGVGDLDQQEEHVRVFLHQFVDFFVDALFEHFGFVLELNEIEDFAVEQDAIYLGVEQRV